MQDNKKPIGNNSIKVFLQLVKVTSPDIFL